MFDEQPDADPHGECAAEIHKLHHLLRAAVSALRSYQHGNSAPDLAASVADKIDAELATGGGNV